MERTGNKTAADRGPALDWEGFFKSFREPDFIPGYEILNKLGVNDELLDIAKTLEETALSDDYFVERKLYPNVDFYTGLIYRALGFPTQYFTVLFALGRLPGWIAHWKEMIEDPGTKIGRPRQIYTGPKETHYVPIEKR